MHFYCPDVCVLALCVQVLKRKGIYERFNLWSLPAPHPDFYLHPNPQLFSVTLHNNPQELCSSFCSLQNVFKIRLLGSGTGGAVSQRLKNLTQTFAEEEMLPTVWPLQSICSHF